MKWKRKENGGAKAHAPENNDPLHVVEKPAAPIGAFAFHHLLLAGNYIGYFESRNGGPVARQGSVRIMAPAPASDQHDGRNRPHALLASTIRIHHSLIHGDSRMKAQSHPDARLKEREQAGPHLTTHEHVGINGRIALAITNAVGTMWCAYVFAIIALISLPSAVQGGVDTRCLGRADFFATGAVVGDHGGPEGCRRRVRQAGAADV